ncbi:MAG: hypothetical protein IJP10_00855 [Clostridia bacterium]|nr:hypothetical protein [Clostridia bacterium]
MNNTNGYNNSIQNGEFFFTVEKSITSLPPSEDRVIIAAPAARQTSRMNMFSGQTGILIAALFAVVLILVIVISAINCGKGGDSDGVSESDAPHNPTQVSESDVEEDDGGLQLIEKQEDD